MTLVNELRDRSSSACELCHSSENLSVYDVPPSSGQSTDQCVLLCAICVGQIDDPKTIDLHHWRCLNDSMWTQVPAVQVMAWRMLNQLSQEPWARDLLDTLYLEDEVLIWAQALTTSSTASDELDIKHTDSHGAQLMTGDTVTLIKDLNVKGAGFTAKRGTAVRGISLVADNEKHIEGRINGQQIVILTEFVKKSN